MNVQESNYEGGNSDGEVRDGGNKKTTDAQKMRGKDKDAEIK